MAHLISVIVPVYNAEAYLERGVKSLCGQTHTCLEIILINDGSVDNSGLLCDQLASADPRIKVVHQENQGVSAARNQGLALATGQWLGFVDADDWVAPDMYEKLLEAARTHQMDISACGHVLHETSGTVYQRTYHHMPPSIPRDTALLYLMGAEYYEGFLCNKLFSKSLVDQLALILDRKLHFCEDLVFCTAFLLAAEGIALAPAAMYHYCMNAGSATKNFNNKRLTELHAREKVIELTADYPLVQETAKHHYADAAINMVYLAVCNYAHKSNPQILRHLRKEGRRYSLGYFLSPQIRTRLKFKSMAILLFPRVSSSLWRWIKQRFNVSFYSHTK